MKNRLINSFFTPLSRHERELIELQLMQEARSIREAKERDIIDLADDDNVSNNISSELITTLLIMKKY
jgi:hypothetical protein